MTRGIGDILNKLQKVKKLANGEYVACCPGHEDNKPSLSVTQEADKILLNCHAGCMPEKIVESIGLTMADLFIKDEPLPQPVKDKPAKIVATYDYQDEKGNLLYQVVRMEPKDFRQRHRNGNDNWVWTMDGVRRVIYHLPDILNAPPDQKIYIVEGEKDADNLWEWGRYATTSPGGAKSWKSDYARYFTGRNVVIIPDKDTAGTAYAQDIIHTLEYVAASIRVIMLPGDPNVIKDISNWLEAGNHPDDLDGLEKDFTYFMDSNKPSYQIKNGETFWLKRVLDGHIYFGASKISNERTGVHAKILVKYEYSNLAWSYLNIERSEDRIRLANQAYSILKKQRTDIDKSYSKEDIQNDIDNFSAGLWDFFVSSFTPELTYGDETQEPLVFILKPYALLEAGTILYAPPGRGKSYTGLLWAQSIHNGCEKFWPVKKTPGLIINLERSRHSMEKRIANVNRVLGLPPKTPIHCIHARGKTLYDVADSCRSYIKKFNIGFIVLDSISRAGLGDLNDNQSMNKIIDTLSSICPSWIALSHTSRANEDHAFGSIMADAGADICVQLSSQITMDGTLGIGWEITKQNDIGKKSMEILALEFNEYGLANVRKAKQYEFPEIEGKRRLDSITTLIEFVQNQDTGDSTASEAADATGLDQGNISRLFLSSGKFVKTRTSGHKVYYGVKTISQ